MNDKTILVWFRNDLRVNDNEILLEATRKASKILPVYIFDPYYFKTAADGILKTGYLRAQFLIESVINLRSNLQALGGNLLVQTGNPAELIPQIAQQYNVSEVYHHREVSFEETAISEQVEAALWKIKLNLKHFIGHTLYHKEDLPFPIKDIPDSFMVFKKKVERDSVVRPVSPSPQQIDIPQGFEEGEIPYIAALGFDKPADTVKPYFCGGEDCGMAQLNKSVEKLMASAGSKAGRGTHADGTKLGPWLALGCLSPRQVYWFYNNHFTHQNNPIVTDLLWRDYFRFMFKKHGSKRFFEPAGFKNTAPQVAADQQQEFNRWINAGTGDAAVDEAMTALNTTGYINNYERQLLSAYLVKQKVDWTLGARWFESRLIDYSPSSNWGNWAFMAGVGNDAKLQKYFEDAQFSPQVQ